MKLWKELLNDWIRTIRNQRTIPFGNSSWTSLKKEILQNGDLGKMFVKDMEEFAKHCANKTGSKELRE